MYILSQTTRKEVGMLRTFIGIKFLSLLFFTYSVVIISKYDFDDLPQYSLEQIYYDGMARFLW